MAQNNYNTGILSGLSYVHNWQQQIQNQQQQELLDRQARIDAENEAKMLGSMFQFGKAANKYDAGILKEFTTGKLKEIGRFTNENPDFKTDAGKWAQFQRMTTELLDNDIVKRAGRIQTHYNTLVDYIQKNPNSVNNPQVQKMLKQYENYDKFGDTDGIQNGGKEFAFFNPEKVDLSKPIIHAAQSLRTKKSEYTKNGTIRWTADPVEVNAVAKMLYDQLGHHADTEFQEMKQKGFNYKDPVDMISQYMMPFTKIDEKFVPQTGGGGSRSSSSSKDAPGSFNNPMWNDITRRVLKSDGKQNWKGHPDAFNAFLRDKDGFINGSEVYFGNSNVPIDLGSRIKGNATGHFKGIPLKDNEGNEYKRGVSQFNVALPLDAFLQLSPDQLGFDPNEVIDYDNIEYGGSFGGNLWTPDWEIHPEYRSIIGMEKDEQGNRYVSLNVDVPFNVEDQRNEGIYNQMAHGKQYEYGQGGPNILQSKIFNGQTIHLLEDGSIVDDNYQPIDPSQFTE